MSAEATALVETPESRARWIVSDAIAMTGRYLMHQIRIPQLFVFATVQPIMFLLMFRYVFGGAIPAPAGLDYPSFLMIGVFAQAVGFGAVGSAIAVADDVGKGLIDRFRSMPMSRSAMLAGKTLADSVRNVVILTILVGIGYLIGFRVRTDIIGVLAGLGIIVFFGYAFSWIGANVGLAVKQTESAQAASFLWLFPLIFASSVFVPTDRMPDWLASFANVQPVTRTVNAARALILDAGPASSDVIAALAWCGGICAVMIPLATWQFKRASW